MNILIIGTQIIEVERQEIETRLEIIVKMKIGMLGAAISKNQTIVMLVIVLDINVVSVGIY